MSTADLPEIVLRKGRSSPVLHWLSEPLMSSQEINLLIDGFLPSLIRDLSDNSVQNQYQHQNFPLNAFEIIIEQLKASVKSAR
jgi:hypothetical protein